jgi:hypothetical protein
LAVVFRLTGFIAANATPAGLAPSVIAATAAKAEACTAGSASFSLS